MNTDASLVATRTIFSFKKCRSHPPTFLPRIFDRFRHQRSVETLRISPDGKLLASGSNETIKLLWNAKDGSLRGSLKLPGMLSGVALSNSVLVAATAMEWDCRITLWNLDTLSPIHTFENLECRVFNVSIAENNALIAITLTLGPRTLIDYDGVGQYDVSLLDVMTKTIIATFHILSHEIHTMTFLPNNSHIVVQPDKGLIQTLNLINQRTIEGPILEHINQLPDTPCWHGVPIWHCMDKDQHYFSALFPQHKKPVPVLWIPKHISVAEWTQGSSMIALSCKDGRVIFLRLNTSHVS